MALAAAVAMVVSRCAWHPFFCGYPRPLRVVSWRGARIAFADTICRSCAERVRIEGLWASSPPPPVWPGSAHTALLFVGLPLLIAVLLMAAPLHDATRPAVRHDATAIADPARAEPVLDKTAVVAPPIRRRAASAAGRPANDRVPDVIFETRRMVPTARQDPRGVGQRLALADMVAASVRGSRTGRTRTPVVPAVEVEAHPLVRDVQSP